MQISINFTKEISAPRKLVFGTITNFGSLQKTLPNVFRSVRILEQKKDYAITEEEFLVFGTIMKQRSMHTIENPSRHIVHIIDGELAGSTIVENYSDSVDGGTTVDVSADFNIGGILSILPAPVLRPLVGDNLRRLFGELEDALKSSR